MYAAMGSNGVIVKGASLCVLQRHCEVTGEPERATL